jgi:hypothetical protein
MSIGGVVDASLAALGDFRCERARSSRSDV